MATSQGASSSGDSGGGRPPQEYTVRVPTANNKKYMIMKFNQSPVDFTKCGAATLVRENNLKEYKLSNDLDQMPKFGAGSEYGRDMREEARRKKYGIMVKKYNPEDQPWHLKSGKGKEAKKHKGVREGGILENASYYIFTQCADGAFEAFPVEEWYNFTPMIRYKYLNSEEAEEEFNRRDKILNHFTIMTKKRLKNEAEEVDDDDEKKTKGKGKGKSKSKKDFLLTELDEWAQLTDEESDDDADAEGEGSDAEKPKKKKEKKKPKKGKGKKTSKKTNSDDEAMEDSDSVDEGQEVDYMTDTDSDDENMYEDSAKVKTNKYEEKGVDQQENSDEEEEEEEEEKKEEEQEEEEDTEKKESASESSGSDSDSDPEKEVSQFSSALFMQAGSKKSKKSGDSSKPNSRSVTPTSQGDGDGNEKAKKRKPTDTGDGASSAKKSKSEGAPLTGSDGVTEEIIRKYLMRKPMTIKDLLQKLHKNTGIQKEKLSETIAPILRRINPDKLKINDKLHLHIKNKKSS